MRKITKIFSLFISFILIFSFLFGDISYAWFINRYVSPQEPKIEGADFTLDVNFANMGSVVNISDGLPTSDPIGLTYDGYEFSVENIGNVPIKVHINVEVEEEQPPYSNNPLISMFRPGEIRDALILKEYLYIDPDNPFNTSTLPDFERWMPNENCIVIENGVPTMKYCIVTPHKRVVNTFHIIPGEIFHFEMKFWISHTVRTVLNKLFYGRIVVETEQADGLTITSTEANTPELVSGMIPVVWDEVNGKWIIIEDWNARWSNYSENDIVDNQENLLAIARQWANAITVPQSQVATYLDCNPITGCSVKPTMIGQPIPESHITNMFVWIPRFRYSVRTTIANRSESLIEIVFENGNSSKFVGTGKYNGKIPTNYYTASAFTHGDIELKGFWMAKFESGSVNNVLSSYAGQQMNRTILDDGWNSAIQNDYVTNGLVNHGLSENSAKEIMQIKNSQWDAVAVLSQSRFGKYGKDATPVLPNNYIDIEVNTTNKTFQQFNSGLLGGSAKWFDINTGVGAIKHEVKSGYVCGLASVFACMNYSPGGHSEVKGTGVATSSGGWLSKQQTYTTENSSKEKITTNSVYYTNPLGGNGSTSGNIYGVFDMFMGREEITSTLFVETGLNQPNLPGFTIMKTFAIPGPNSSTLYVNEKGVVYNSNGDVAYSSFLQMDSALLTEYVIKDNVDFEIDQFAYFQNRFHIYENNGSNLIVEKGSAIYLLDSTNSGFSLFGAKVDHSGDNYNYLSRGGVLTAEIEVEYDIVYTGNPTHVINSINNSYNVQPSNTNSGIFAQFASRVVPTQYSITSTIDATSAGGYAINFKDAVPVIGTIARNTTSRVVILNW